MRKQKIHTKQDHNQSFQTKEMGNNNGNDQKAC